MYLSLKVLRSQDLGNIHHIGRGVSKAHDKVSMMQGEEHAESQQRNLVYVRDIPSNILRLLLVSVGICIRNDTMSSEQKALQDIFET